MDTHWWADIAQIAGGIAAFFSLPIGAWQLRRNARQQRTAFEDGLNQQYRTIAADLPVGALLGQAGTVLPEQLSYFYRYFDLCNEQFLLRSDRRVSHHTWVQWRAGIESNAERSQFKDAWGQMFGAVDPSANTGSPKPADFKELRRLIVSGYTADPGHRWWARGRFA